jgi:hypothetical protein
LRVARQTLWFWQSIARFLVVRFNDDDSLRDELVQGMGCLFLGDASVSTDSF